MWGQYSWARRASFFTGNLPVLSKPPSSFALVQAGCSSLGQAARMGIEEGVSSHYEACSLSQQSISSEIQLGDESEPAELHQKYVHLTLAYRPSALFAEPPFWVITTRTNG